MPLGEAVSSTLLVKVKGTPLPADVAPLLVNGYVDDSSNVPDLFLLRFSDEAGTVLAKGGFEIGVEVELSVQSSAPGGPQRLHLGEVTAIEVELTEQGVHTVVRGLDKSHRLFRGTRVEAYLSMKASDIVQKVAQRAGLTAKVEPTTQQLEHVAQDGISDWEFLRRLATENGRVLSMVEGQLEFVKRPESATATTATDARADPLVLERGVNLVNVRALITSNGQVPDVEVRGWDPQAKRAVVAGKPATTVSAQLDTVTPAKLAQTFASPTYVEANATVAVQAIAEAAAESLADHLAGGFAELEGTARGNPALRAGIPVALAGVAAPFAGRYVLTSTRHSFSPENGYLTTFVVSNTSERSLYATASRGTGRRAAPSVVPALVTNVKDPEKRGRVKVTFPWLSDTYESWWARPVLAGAGPKRGLCVLPEVNDEVLVAFENGDLDHPYVLGGLYNGKDQPDKPWAEHVNDTDGSVQRRAWTSRTGMCIEYVESPQDEKLVVSTNGGAQRITLVQKSTKAIQIISEGPVEVTAKEKVTVTAKQDVTVTSSGGNVSLKGMDVKVEGTNVTIDAKGNLELKGVSAKVTGQASAELSASGTTTVRGSMVKIN